jgi:hypothetical protein
MPDKYEAMPFDREALEKFRLLLRILETSREARDAVRLTLDVIEQLPGGAMALRNELGGGKR